MYEGGDLKLFISHLYVITMTFCHQNEELLTKYFQDALCLFHKTQWIYNHPVTEILVKGSLDDIPKEWLDVLQSLSSEELNNFVVNKTLVSKFR